MRHALLPFVALMLAALAPVAASQEPATPASTPAPVSAFRVTHYDLKATIAPATRSLEATAGVTIESWTAGLRTLRLYLHGEFTVRQASEAGRVLTFTQPKDTGDKRMFSPGAVPLDIDLGRDLAKGERVTFVIDYGGPISRSIGGINLISPSLTELASYAAWFPMEKQDGAFTYELILTTPADHAVAVTDGRELRWSASATAITRAFRRDHLGDDIPLVTGPGLKLRERRVGDVAVRFVFESLDEQAAAGTLDGAIRCLQDMTARFGPPVASGAFTVVFSPRGGWGYSRVPLIVGPEATTKLQLTSEAGRIEASRGAAHEAGHFWWNLASTSTADDWLNESLAEYSSLRSIEHLVSGTAIAGIWKEQHRAANGAPPEKSILGTLRNDPAAYALYYRRGSWIFRTLETWLGRAELDRMLARFYRQHRGRRDATTDSFLAVVRQETGSRFDAFFDRLLRRGGLPQVRLRWTAAPREAAGTVTLDDPALVGFPLTVRVKGREMGESADRTVALQPGETTWRFALPFEPVTVTMDPDWRMLRADPDAAFAARLMMLVHGLNMDVLPELRIPKANIEKALTIVDEWGRTVERSAELDYERGWLAFLEGRTVEAAEFFKSLLPRLEDLPNKQFHIPGTYMNLGRIHDVLGDRQAALGYYREGLRRSAGLGVDSAALLGYFQNYLEVPYPRGRSVHFAAFIGLQTLVEELVTASPGIINSKDAYRGVTPIVWALQLSVKRPLIEWLVEHGADVNAKDENGQTVLEIVRAKGETELAEYLASKGAK